jgi:hypothetical protein
MTLGLAQQGLTSVVTAEVAARHGGPAGPTRRGLPEAQAALAAAGQNPNDSGTESGTALRKCVRGLARLEGIEPPTTV